MFNFNGHKECILRIMNNLNGREEYFLWKGGCTRTALGPLLNIQSYSQENTQYPLDDVFREVDVVDLRQGSVRNTCFYV